MRASASVHMAIWLLDRTVHRYGRGFHQPGPHLEYRRALGWQHAILQAIEAFAVDGGHEAAGDETENDSGREVVFAESVAELEVLIERCTER